MFSLLNGIYDSYLAPVQLNVLVVGGPGCGKTALLERLKVTEIPSRPRGGGVGRSNSSQAMSERMAAEELTPNLTTAFAETGALHIRRQMAEQKERQRRREIGHGSSFSSTTAAAEDPTDGGGEQQQSTTGGSSTTVTVKQKKRFSFCPAPQRYLKAAQDDQDDEDDEEDAGSIVDDGKEDADQRTTEPKEKEGRAGWEQEMMDELNQEETASVTSDAPQRVRCHSKELNMESLDLMDGRRSSMQDIPLDQPLSSLSSPSKHQHQKQNLRRRNSNDSDGSNEDIRPPPLSSSSMTTTTSQQQQQQQPVIVMPPQNQRPAGGGHNAPLRQTSSEEYNTKSKVTMLPLRLIRPTIGTNLKKIDMYGALCHLFDVGGRLQDLWERYYDDCDAVVFCWKLGDDPESAKNDNDDDKDNDDDDPEELYKKQQIILNQVRKSIPDDVPFLVFGHVFGNANVDMTDRMFSTDMLLPHYHNPMTSMCCGSAKTGAGVQSAMEWLIPLSKRQQKERQQEKRQLEEKQL